MTTSSTPTKPTLTPEDALRLRKASDPQVSPDGRAVAFCVAPLSQEGEHPTGTIMRVSTDSGATPRPFTTGPGLDNAPRWSPDGAWLAFISDRHERGKPALYLMPADGGEAERLVTERGEASDPRWSPDGARLSFLLKEIDSEDEEKRKKEGRDDAVVVDDDKYTRLWLVDAASRAVTRLSPDGVNVWAHTWSPAGASGATGDRIALLHTATPHINDYFGGSTLSMLAVGGAGADARSDGAKTGSADVPSVPVTFEGVGSPPGTGEQRSERPALSGTASTPPDNAAGVPVGPLTTVCRVEGVAESLCWSPDGSCLALVAPALQRRFTSSAAAPLVVAASGGALQALVQDHPAEFSYVAWLSDDTLVAAGVEGLHGVYYRVTLDGEVAALLPDGQPAPSSPRDVALGPDRATLTVVQATTTSPGDVWAARPRESLTRLTTLNPDLEGLAWGEVEQVSWHAPDGLEVQGLLIKPVGYEPGRRYPTIVHVHGGPAWQWSEGFYATWHDWDQFLAARGYAVLLPNPRGSTGRGTAYVGANYDDVGGGEWQDVLAGVHYAIGRGIADPDRLGIGGWSWGGYLTAWAVTQTDIFKGAVMGAGLSNLLSDHGQNDIPDANRLYFRGLPYHDAPAYWDPSPIKHVARVKTPTLILHGEKDDRVAPAQGREFYRALKTLGVPTQFVLYPREPHGFTERAHQRDVITRVLDWFEKYVKLSAVSDQQSATSSSTAEISTSQGAATPTKKLTADR